MHTDIHTSRVCVYIHLHVCIYEGVCVCVCVCLGVRLSVYSETHTDLHIVRIPIPKETTKN